MGSNDVNGLALCWFGNGLPQNDPSCCKSWPFVGSHKHHFENNGKPNPSMEHRQYAKHYATCFEKNDPMQPLIWKLVAHLMHSIGNSHKTQIGEVSKLRIDICIDVKTPKIRRCATWGDSWWVKKRNNKDYEYHTISLVLVVMGIALAAVV